MANYGYFSEEWSNCDWSGKTTDVIKPD